MSTFDIAFFSYKNHYWNLENGLRDVITNVPNFNKLVLIWDDNLDDERVEFDDIKSRIGYDFHVVRHSELSDVPWEIITWGWIKQQLAKMLCFKYSNADYTWIVDGDIIVTGDPELFVNNKPVIRYRPYYLLGQDPARPLQPEYFNFIKTYLKINNQYPFDLVGSSCLFDNQIVEEIWSRCLEINSRDLVACVEEQIIDKRGLNMRLPFSEFFTYGNYCYNYHRDKFHFAECNWNESIETFQWTEATKFDNLHYPIHHQQWIDYDPDVNKARKIVLDGYKNAHKL